MTKSKFDNKYGCKESLVDAIRRAADVMMAGKVAVVGYGDVGKVQLPHLEELELELLLLRLILFVHCKQLWMVSQLKEWMRYVNVDIIVTTTGNKDIIQAHHFETMRDKTIVCNIGHFDNEIDVAWLNDN